LGRRNPPRIPSFSRAVAHLVDRQIDRLHRQHRDPEQALGYGLQ